MANKFRIFGSVPILIFFITIQHLLSCDNVTFIKGLTNTIHTFFRHFCFVFLLNI
jgi:hypothetical protein